jgi:hypothetical protein
VSARTREAGDDGPLHPRCDRADLQDREPARWPERAAPQACEARHRGAADAVAPQPGPVLNLYRRRPCRFCSVIPEIDIWRAAQLMLKRYGEKAEAESAARADELALAGDDEGAATWRRIMAAVLQLSNKTAGGLLH